MEHLHRWKRNFLTHTCPDFRTNALHGILELLTAPPAKAIKHIEGYLGVEHELAKRLKRKQFSRLRFQLFDPRAARFGYRQKVNRVHPQKP